MRTQEVHNLGRPLVPGKKALLIPMALLLASPCARAQTPPDAPGAGTPAQQPPKTAPASGALAPAGGWAESGAQTAGQAPPSGAPKPSDVGPQAAAPPAASVLRIEGMNGIQGDSRGNFSATGPLTVKLQNTTISSDKVEGNTHEFVFSGNAKIESQGASAYADSIHVFPDSRSFRLINPRGVLLPEFVRDRITEPLYISGGDAAGTTSGYFFAEQFIATTCREHFHHYEFRIGEAELFPADKLVLHKVTAYLFGVKLITIPYIVIPLNLNPRVRRARTDYLPEFGQNEIEGYYARFPYSFTEGSTAATFLRFDVTQKKAEGYRFEQEYLAGKQVSAFNTSGVGPQNGGFTGATSGTIATSIGGGTTGRLPSLGSGLGPQSGGLFAIQGYFGEGFNRDFNGSFRHQQGIGSNNQIAFSTEIQNISALIGSSQSNETTRFNFNHTDPSHGVTTDVTIGLNTTSSGTTGSQFDSSQFTAGYHQTFDFGTSGSNRNALTYSFDLSRTTSDSDIGGMDFASRSARLDSQFQFQHSSRDYSLTLAANKTTPIGIQTDNSAFGTLEKLPELMLSTDTYNFKGGFLHSLPLHFDFGIGRYSEPSHNFQDDRALLGITVQPFSILKGRTELTTGGGFEQRLYSDGAAQYIVRNQTALRQHLLGRSGIDIRYDYSQPEGGTPFQFDTYGRSHSITAEAGYLDDKHFQLTARVGYDLLGTSAANPFQSLSTRMMWRPTQSFRLDLLSTYDPNTGKLFSITNRTSIRAKDDFAIDLITQIDPQQPGIRRKFSQINVQFETPAGRTWKFYGLLRYNGATSQFESINVQAVHEWDCLEASVTYSETPFAFRPDREIFFTLRIKGLPFSRSFARGPAGETLGVGIGQFN